ncbi:heme ABC exporter ATP-binding protein CcmA [Rhodococcus sp. BP-241]|uniref:heme ABC exporter ATP-binding protein CcmA n=1 Tax=Rhodococcus sp. BP-241 TaxID=2739441 RepID=UPI001C9A539B|nr:heme ABC exporter ATP-binding protein CcmA [Rhodococcus sp. BP-241]MBY6706198.1 heme ABC exporter ATP-binding protein CcmA [Rhodococcus sp. BP-241]
MVPDIVVKGTSVRFSRGSHIVFDKADFELSAGQRVGLVGANGSGKTTLMRLVCGLLEPSIGSVSTFGQLATAMSLENRRKTSLFLGGEASLYDRLTAKENIEYFAQLGGMSRRESRSATRSIMSKLDVTWYAEKAIRETSRGMRQRVALARALVHQPELVLLDEPTTGMDVEGVQLFQDLIMSEVLRGTAMVISGHNALELTKLCDNYWVTSDSTVYPATRHTLDLLPDVPAADALRQALNGVRFV